MHRMKKLTTFLLIILYSFAMGGTTIALHYCMGDKVSAGLGYSGQDSCEACPMKSHKTTDPGQCCSDETQFVKVTSDQDLPLPNVTPKAPVTIIDYPVYTNAKTAIGNQTAVLFIERSEPPDIAVYSRNCNFRI